MRKDFCKLNRCNLIVVNMNYDTRDPLDRKGW